MIHHHQLIFPFNPSLRRTLKLIHQALSCSWIGMCQPLGYLIDRIPSGIDHSNSYLHAADSFIFGMGFWWYHKWSAETQACTLRYIKNGKDGKLIAKYASLIIIYVAAFYFLTIINMFNTDPHPVVLMCVDNTTAEAWTIKASKASVAVRSLGRTQCYYDQQLCGH